MDVLKGVAVLLLIAIAAVALGTGIAGLSDGASNGGAAFAVLDTHPTGAGGYPGDFSPLDVTRLFLDELSGAAGFDVGGAMSAAFGAVLMAAAGIYAFKLVGKIVSA